MNLELLILQKCLNLIYSNHFGQMTASHVSRLSFGFGNVNKNKNTNRNFLENVFE